MYIYKIYTYINGIGNFKTTECMYKIEKNVLRLYISLHNIIFS